MESKLIHQATDHITPGQAKNELQPLKNGEVQEFEQALQGVKVCNASVASLEAVLRRVMLLVGIRANNLPNDVERQILTAFIQKKFGQLTLNEIQIAFEKAVAGELDIETASCFENFSCDYFGRIISAYKKWASQKFNENQMYLLYLPYQTAHTMEADWKELCEAYYQDYLQNRFLFSVMPYQLYDEFVSCKMMAEDVYEDYIPMSRMSLSLEIKAEIGEVYTEKEKDELRSKMNEILDGHNEWKVEQYAKKLAVEFLYKTAKQKGFQNLFIKE